MKYWLALLTLLISCSVGAQENPRALLIVLDGLRPDYVTPEIMPHLHAFAAEGLFFEKHHSTYPTVTRVNATSIVTGAYPERHGIMDNTVYFPQVNPAKGLSTGSRSSLERILEATGGKLLTAPDLGQILREAGQSYFVGSAGSSGSAFLLNHTGYGMTVHNEYVLPKAEEERVIQLIGPEPPESAPNDAQNGRAVDAYLKLGMDAAPLAVLWLSDPDHTGHEKGIGDPVTMESLRLVDGQVGRLFQGLEERGLLGKTNIMITSDHGFASYQSQGSPEELFRSFMTEQGEDPANLVVAGQGIYLRSNKEKLLPLLVQRMQETPWMGALFTRGAGDALDGAVAGTFSLAAVRMDHERAPDIVFSPNWSDDKNAHGWPGTTFTPGVAGHGSASAWEVHNTLIAHGPAFKKGMRSLVPSHNVDLAPTLLHLLGMAQPPTMEGRVLEEALAEGPDPESVSVEVKTHQVSAGLPEGAGYSAVLQESVVAGKRYFDFAQAEHRAAKEK